jgi:hypothetical protein
MRETAGVIVASCQYDRGYYFFNYKNELSMPCGKKRKRHKIATHKRKKRLRKNRHKKKNK